MTMLTLLTAEPESNRNYRAHVILPAPFLGCTRIYEYFLYVFFLYFLLHHTLHENKILIQTHTLVISASQHAFGHYVVINRGTELWKEGEERKEVERSGHQEYESQSTTDIMYLFIISIYQHQHET